jgi:O-acetyl-ADP-ribose deacetylase (regulator of RNase III)
MPILYVVGDATRPQGAGAKVIVHCVNDIGVWGAGFVLAIDRRWAIVADRYRSWHRAPQPDAPFHLGAVQFVEVEPQLWVANLVGQHRTIREGELIPIRYEALTLGFQTVATFCRGRQASVHAPRLGAGLARGSWSKIAKLLERELVDREIPVTVYDIT